MKSINVVKISLVIILVFLLSAGGAGSGKAEPGSTLDISPVRLAFDGNGDLLVSDYTYGRILTVAPDTLDIIGEFDINGRPLGVAWTNDFVYVGNSTTGMVEVYNTAGVEQFVLGTVLTPLDMAVGSGNVYVVDGSARLVKIFTQDGTFVGTIPENGYDPDILANPTAITVDTDTRRIYVSDYGDLGNAGSPISPRIQVFGFDGSLSLTINAGTSDRYRFTMPQGLTLNGNNKLFVIDSLTGKIFVYNATTGTLLRKIRRTGRGGRSIMKLPLDLVIDPSTQDVFVTNNRMASIKVFAGAGGTR
jgi:DNA-binding beta-propeller fold protein YncE